MCHNDNSFLTLTYDDDHLPDKGNLVPADTQKWLKRFRKAIAPKKVRYFLVGEYGEKSGRPHYHASLFGVGPEYLPVVQQTWSKGFCSLYEFNETTAQYVAGYIIKKLTRKGDPKLNGKHPEFARMSNRPGIGADAMQIIADQLHSDAGLDSILAEGDVPKSLKIGKKQYPLGRYLRRKLREEMGFTEKMVEQIKAAFFEEANEEMLRLYEEAVENGNIYKEGYLNTKQRYQKEHEGSIRSIKARQKIFEQRRQL
jgi:hypothetical protein